MSYSKGPSEGGEPQVEVTVFCVVHFSSPAALGHLEGRELGC